MVSPTIKSLNNLYTPMNNTGKEHHLSQISCLTNTQHNIMSIHYANRPVAFFASRLFANCCLGVVASMGIPMGYTRPAGWIWLRDEMLGTLTTVLGGAEVTIWAELGVDTWPPEPVNNKHKLNRDWQHVQSKYNEQYYVVTMWIELIPIWPMTAAV